SERSADPDCIKAVDLMLQSLESLGHIIETSGPRALDGADGMEGFLPILWASLAHELDRWSQRTGRTIGPDDTEPMTWRQAEAGRRLSARDFLDASDSLHAFSRDMAEWWSSGFDVLVTPTMSEPPVLLGAKVPEDPTFSTD